MTRYGHKLMNSYFVLSDGNLIEGELVEALVDYNCFNDYSAFFGTTDGIIYTSHFFKNNERATLFTADIPNTKKIKLTGYSRSDKLMDEILDDIYEKIPIEEDNSVTEEELKARINSVSSKRFGTDTETISMMLGLKDVINMSKGMHISKERGS